MGFCLEKTQLERIKAHFDSPLTDYDWCADRVVIKNTELHNALVAAIQFPHDASLKMLDLGIGTGQASLWVLESFQNAHIDGMDISDAMLAQAKKRIEFRKGQVRLIKADFTSDILSNYDVVFSAVTIHNLLDRDKRGLFKTIHAHLNKGGCFVNADFFKPKLPAIAKSKKEAYVNFVKKNLRDEELKHWLRHIEKEDFPATLEDQFSWLREAGFRDVETTWLYENLAVYCALK